MQINRWLHLSGSLQWISLAKFPSLRHVEKKNRREKFVFIVTNNWTVLAVFYSRIVFTVCKIFFCSEFPDIPQKFDKRKRNWQFQSISLHRQKQQAYQLLFKRIRLYYSWLGVVVIGNCHILKHLAEIHISFTALWNTWHSLK